MPTEPVTIPRIQDALGASFLAGIPATERDILLRDSTLMVVPAGAIFIGHDDGDWTGVLISGLARVFLSSPDGRQQTVRYARPGSTVGIAAMSGGRSTVLVQAVIRSRVMRLSRDALVRVGHTSAEAAWAMVAEVTSAYDDVLAALETRAFGSARQRLARQLIDLAADHGTGQLEVTASQQHLADAIGTTRETVNRELNNLEALDLIRRAGRCIVIADPVRLHLVGHSRTTPDATVVPEVGS